MKKAHKALKLELEGLRGLETKYSLMLVHALTISI